MDISVFVIMCSIIIYQAVEKYVDRKEYLSREKNLLDRIMAKNYVEYAKLEPRDEKIQVVRVDDLLKDQEEKGIPVY